MAPPEINGFSAPIRQSGIKPDLIAGVPRRFMVLNAVLALELILGLRLYEAFFIPFIVHAIGYHLYNKVDIDFFEVLSRYIKTPDHLEP